MRVSFVSDIREMSSTKITEKCYSYLEKYSKSMVPLEEEEGI